MKIVDPILDETIPMEDVPSVTPAELIRDARMYEREALRDLISCGGPGTFMHDWQVGRASALRGVAQSLRRSAARIIDEIDETREWEANRPRVYLSIELVHRDTDEVVATGPPQEV